MLMAAALGATLVAVAVSLAIAWRLAPKGGSRACSRCDRSAGPRRARADALRRAPRCADRCRDRPPAPRAPSRLRRRPRRGDRDQALPAAPSPARDRVRPAPKRAGGGGALCRARRRDGRGGVLAVPRDGSIGDVVLGEGTALARPAGREPRRQRRSRRRRVAREARARHRARVGRRGGHRIGAQRRCRRHGRQPCWASCAPFSRSRSSSGSGAPRFARRAFAAPGSSAAARRSSPPSSHSGAFSHHSSCSGYSRSCRSSRAAAVALRSRSSWLRWPRRTLWFPELYRDYVNDREPFATAFLLGRNALLVALLVVLVCAASLGYGCDPRRGHRLRAARAPARAGPRSPARAYTVSTVTNRHDERRRRRGRR